MKWMSRICLVILSVFILSVMFSPVVCFAQEEEEEEVLQARPNPMSKPNPMERTMRKSAGVNTVMLKDGRKLQQGLQGGKQAWFLVGKNGKRTLANGSFTLQNGSRLNVRRGAMNQAQMRNLPQTR